MNAAPNMPDESSPKPQGIEASPRLRVVCPDAEVPTTEAPVPGALPMPGGLCHAVYSELLDGLELSFDHFEALRRLGLPPVEINRRLYRTADAGKAFKLVDALLAKFGRERLLLVPGFQEKNDRVVFLPRSGLLIPVRDAHGRIVGLRDSPAGAVTGAPRPSAGRHGGGGLVHVPLGVRPPAPLVRVTAGELTADVATVAGALATIAVPEPARWELAVPVLRELGAGAVRVALDQDGSTATLAATEQALCGLTRAGLDVALEWWDGRAATDIAGLLTADGQPEVITGLPALVRVRDALTPAFSAAEAEPEPEPFPVDVFPPALAAYLGEVAAATSTPPDFTALTMVVTAAAAIGNSRALALKDQVWYESPRFYAVNVGNPGSGKTPAMEAVVRPYEAAQLRLLEDYRDARAEHDRARQRHEQALRENRSVARDQRRPLPALPPAPEPPERFVVVDATVESLAPLLERNPRGLLMPQDEGVGWVRGMGQYKGGKGNDRQFWLSAWSGRSYVVDRKSQGGVAVSIRSPFVNVICGVQPDMLNELADHHGRDDGFLHRLLFAFPRTSGGADWTEATISPASQRAWEGTLGRLRGLALAEGPDGQGGPRVVRLSEAAREAWVNWWNAHAAEIRDPALPAPLIGPWGKLKSYAARLALVLHCLWLVQADQAEEDVGADSVGRAVRLVGYFKSHLRLVYGRLRVTPEDNHLDEVLDWVRQHGGACTARDLVRAKKVTPTDKARKMMTELAERGFGRLEAREARNHKQVLWFVFDPS